MFARTAKNVKGPNSSLLYKKNMIVTLKQILSKAMSGGWAVPAFNINNMEILQAVMQAALESKSPVILQTSESAIEYAGGLQQIASMLNMAAVDAGVPVCIHLDHGKDLELIHRAMKFGYSSVMYDGSDLPTPENIKNTRKVVEWAKKFGISVEAELGAIKGVEDKVNIKDKEAFFTVPAEAGEFVQKTGIDALAISIGTSHGVYKFKGQAELDWERLKKIRHIVNVPLVLHGASSIDEKTVKEIIRLGGKIEGAKGLGEKVLKKAVVLGISKVNTDSDLRLAFVLGLRKILRDKPNNVDPRHIMKGAMSEIKKMAINKFKVLGAYGKA